MQRRRQLWLRVRPRACANIGLATGRATGGKEIGRGEERAGCAKRSGRVHRDRARSFRFWIAGVWRPDSLSLQTQMRPCPRAEMTGCCVDGPSFEVRGAKRRPLASRARPSGTRQVRWVPQ
eukprot:354625-Chlamydomonas_euryale.AAC.1